MDPPESASEAVIRQFDRYGARNYEPLPVVIARGEGIWVWDAEGKRYMDLLSGYSALNLGHRHPAVIRALKDQADRITLTSRAFYNDQLGLFLEQAAKLTGKSTVLPMNTGAEAVETAIKAVRRWAYRYKGVAPKQAEIIVCEGNFHGRTITVTSFSSSPEYREGFGPFTPGFRLVPFGDIEALRTAINPNTAAFLVEPIQGEAGVIVPPPGYLRQAKQLCRKHNVLFVADEIQTGFGRTGKRFACEWDNVVPDAYILGKALGGGVMPISAVAADHSVLGVFEPGSHGSTFGGNPLACAVAIAALGAIESERLADRSLALGRYLIDRLKQLRNPLIREVRGAGLFVGIELIVPARPYCEQLLNDGFLCKDTHGNTIRIAPPLIITEAELECVIAAIHSVLTS
ncbi:ornithine--oxo-acid transaminase [Cohnella panacarvi]|uniref:ornithine--oxo-acid transaminase n=1 Tax=Cohnella panacarvi TaxID=400776 RepID=UPI0004797688|nr:ornithine--oxo-acid transaminase [Cohnella panacarvi]